MNFTSFDCDPGGLRPRGGGPIEQEQRYPQLVTEGHFGSDFLTIFKDFKAGLISLTLFWKVLDAYFGIFLGVSDLYKSFPKQCGNTEGFLR